MRRLLKFLLFPLILFGCEKFSTNDKIENNVIKKYIGYSREHKVSRCIEHIQIDYVDYLVFGKEDTLKLNFDEHKFTLDTLYQNGGHIHDPISGNVYLYDNCKYGFGEFFPEENKLILIYSENQISLSHQTTYSGFISTYDAIQYDLFSFEGIYFSKDTLDHDSVFITKDKVEDIYNIKIKSKTFDNGFINIEAFFECDNLINLNTNNVSSLIVFYYQDLMHVTITLSEAEYYFFIGEKVGGLNFP